MFSKSNAYGLTGGTQTPDGNASNQRIDVRQMLRDNAAISQLTDANGALVLDSKPLSSIRIAALSGFGLLMGAALMIVGTSLVRAENDAGIFEFVNSEARAQRAQKQRVSLHENQLRRSTQASLAPAPSVRSSSNSRNSDAHASNASVQELRVTGDAVSQKPFKQHVKAKPASAMIRSPGSEQVAAGMSRRTVCVRMCDGYHFPIGTLTQNSDLPAHEAMCKAMCPTAPVKIYTVSSGEDSISNAVSTDGKPYRSLPMAYAHETSNDPSCGCDIGIDAPKITLLKDPTLRRGDAVMVEGNAKVFNGASGRQISRSDFTDFRKSRALSAPEIRRLDAVVGLSQKEATLRELKRKSRVREARGLNVFTNRASDEMPIVIRSGTSEGTRTTVRVVTPSMFSQPR